MRKKTMAIAIITALLLVAGQAFCGDLYGEIKDANGMPVLEATLTAKFVNDNDSTVEAKSGHNGRYRLRTTRTGPATLQVKLKDSQTSTVINVYFFQTSNRLNLKVRKIGTELKLSKE